MTDTVSFPVWNEPVRIHTFDVGPDNRATAPALGRYLQEAASRQAASLGFGYDSLGQNDLFWVLSRIAVEIYRYPRWNEELSLYTWPAGLAPPYALRSFRMTTSSGETVLEAGSAWLTIESSTRRPRRIETVVSAESYKGAEQVLAGKLTRIRPPARGAQSGWEERRSVRLSDLDGQNHTNNMTYLEWLLDGFETQQPARYELAGYSMNFLKETHIAEDMELWYVPESANQGRAGIERTTDGAVVLTAELSFRPRSE